MSPVPGCWPRPRRSKRARPLLAALDEAMRERKAETVAPDLARAIVELADRDPGDVTLTRLAARLGSQPALERARAIAADRRASEADRLAMLDLLGELKDRASVRLLLDLATRRRIGCRARSGTRRSSALGRFEDDIDRRRLLAAYPRQDEAWRSPGARAALEPSLVGAGLPGGDRPRASFRPAR